MKQTGTKLIVIWEEIATPDAQQRLASAFAMLLSPPTSPEQDLDSQD